MATLSLVACGGGGNAIDNNPEKPVTGDSKILVAYFSWSGNTQQLANWVVEKSDGELFRIVPEEAYASDFDGCADRAQTELRNGTRPPLSSHIEEEIMAEYDVSGKTIIPFFSHNGSSSGASSISTIKRLCPDSTVVDDYLSVRGSSVSSAESQVTSWINDLGIKTED